MVVPYAQLMPDWHGKEHKKRNRNAIR